MLHGVTGVIKMSLLADSRGDRTRAAAVGHLSIVTYLVEKGANKEAPDFVRWEGDMLEAALTAAAGGAHAADARLLQERPEPSPLPGGEGRADRRKGPAGACSRRGSPAPALRRLCPLFLTPPRSQYGHTALSCAAQWGAVPVVHYLVSRGASVTETDKFGCTPLGWAAAEGHREVVELLAAKGAAAGARGRNGRTPLHDAAAGGHVGVVEFLLASRVDFDARDDDGRTPLIAACLKGRIPVIRMLLNAGADTSAVDVDKRGASELAGQENSEQLAAEVRVLLAGAAAPAAAAPAGKDAHTANGEAGAAGP